MFDKYSNRRVLYEESLMHIQLNIRGQKFHVWSIAKSMYRIIKGFLDRKGTIQYIHKENANVLHGKCSDFVYAPKNEKLKLAELHTYIHSYIFKGGWYGLRNFACFHYATAHPTDSQNQCAMPLCFLYHCVTHVHKKILYKIFLQMQI